MEIKRKINETEEQMLWRLGQAKDSGLLDASWDEIADVMNQEFRADVSEYRTSSAYRKYYQYARNFFNAGIFNGKTDDKYVEELREMKHEVRREKQKLFDERVALNRQLREQARTDNDLAYLEKLIKERSFKAMDVITPPPFVSDHDMIVCVSDLHYGIKSDNTFGAYDSSIAKMRMKEYASEIIQLQHTHHCENVYVLLLGDIISGEIHQTVQLENRENLTEQVQGAAELLSSFVHILSGVFQNVYINGVAGNHSRTSYKDDVLRGNRLDNLIPWYMKAALSHIGNVHFVDKYNYDETICNVKVRGNEFLGVHGDFDSFSEAGVSKLVMMLGHRPAGIFYGHMHHNSFDDISGVKIMRSGSFSGTGDNYSIQKRLYGEPGQMVAIVGDNGVECIYPIDLSSLTK